MSHSGNGCWRIDSLTVSGLLGRARGFSLSPFGDPALKRVQNRITPPQKFARHQSMSAASFHFLQEDAGEQITEEIRVFLRGSA
jgi:hypothetical protein